MFEGPPKKEENVVGLEEREKMYEVAKRSLGAIFKTNPDSESRIGPIEEEVKRMSSYIKDSERILAGLDECAAIKDRKEFVEKVFEVIKPMIDLKISNPQVFLIEGEEEREFIEINEVLSYEKKGSGAIEMHLIPKEVHRDIYKRLTDGLRRLAKIINQDKNIEIIEAESWIVTRHPKIVQKFGLTIDDIRAGKAHISREDFLKNYLQ